MVLEFADLFRIGNVMNYIFNYKYEQHQADSEEGFTGLGIEPSNSKTWFNLVRDQSK